MPLVASTLVRIRKEECSRLFSSDSGDGKIRVFTCFESMTGQGKSVASMGVNFVHHIGGV